MPHNKRNAAARAIQAETGWPYTRALREADRRHAEAQAQAQGGEESEARFTRTLESDPAAAGIERHPFPDAVFIAPDGG